MKHVEIRAKGLINPDWSSWLDGITIAHQEEKFSMISGFIKDMAAFYGLLEKLQSLGVELEMVKYE